MQIREIEIYSSKQIRAFIKYLEASAEEQEAREEQQKQWSTQGLMGGVIGTGLGLNQAQATPEYLAKCRAAASQG
jgi:hypothetical protein